MRKKILILLPVLLIVSCNNKNKLYRDPVFPDKGELSCKIISEPLPVGYPIAVCGYGNDLFVLASSPEGWVHVYNKDNGKYKGSHIKFGRGPGEAANAIQMDVDTQTGELSIYDEASAKMLLYDIDTLSGRIFTFKQETDFAQYGQPVRQAWKLQDGRYLAFGQIGVCNGTLGRFQLLSNDAVSGYNVFPTSDTDIGKKAFLSSFYTLSPDRAKFVNGTLFGAILETFDVSGEQIRPIGQRLIYPPLIEFQSGVVHHKEDMLWGFSSLCASDSRIYGVFINSDDPNDFDSIAVFDWECNEVSYYDLDYNILRLFYTVESPDKLYAIVVYKHEYYLASIDISI